MDYRLKDFATKLKKTTHFSAFTCSLEACPLFPSCTQIPSQGQLFGNKKAKVLFVFGSPGEEDSYFSTPAVSPAGIYFRDKWLSPFITEVGGVPYLITYLVKGALPEAKTSQSEFEYCWQHFYESLLINKPEVIVAFGSNVFEQLYKKAKNKEKLPDPDSHGVGKLRLNPMVVQFDDDYSSTVYVNYAPSFILKSPASASYFAEDRDRVINHFCPNKKNISKQTITVDKVDLIDTVDGALDFIDFLTRGLPRNEMFDLAFDTETENLNRVYNNKFLSWQFTWEENKAVFIPIEHPDRSVFEKIEDKVKLINAFQKLLNSSPEKTRIAWILGHNIKFDLSILYGLFKILPRGSIPLWDTLLGMHWLDENRKSMGAVLEGKPYSLKTLGKELFGFNYKSAAIEARADGDLVSLTFDDLVEYGGSDTILTWHLKQKQMQLANLQPDNALPKLERFMQRYYSPASRAIALMECNGIYVANKQLDHLQGEESPIWNRLLQIENVELQESPEVKDFRQMNQKLLQGETDVSYDDLWGEEEDTSSLPIFNPNKQEQAASFYLDFLMLEPLTHSKKTKKATLNKAFLNHYAANDVYLALPVIAPYLEYYKTPISHEDDESVLPKNPLQLILEHRELSKLGNTYLKNIGEMIEDKKGDCIDNRVRASFWLAGTDTGRLSSSNPNLQQLPSGRSPMAKEIKNLFQAEPPSKKFLQGTCLIQLDYKTAEVRWAAIFANDKNLIRIFNEARDALLKACDPNSNISEEEFQKTQLASDIHRQTASLMNGVLPTEVTKAMRQTVKAITFGLLFGMGTQTLATNNGWSLEEATEKVNMFFSAFPELKTWLENAPKRAKARGYMETIMGRRRRLDFLFATKNFRDENKASRLAMNAPIQGQSSDGGTIGVFQFLQFLLDNKLERRWLIQNVVHDSVLVQVPIPDIEKALTAMQYYFVDGMSEYIKKYFNFTLPLPIECEIEIGLKYGDLTKWDGRPSTLPILIEKIKQDAKALWYTKKEVTDKPSKDLDLVKYQ
jgi:uracil-DNA glycosylase family 4